MYRIRIQKKKDKNMGKKQDSLTEKNIGDQKHLNLDQARIKKNPYLPQ